MCYCCEKWRMANVALPVSLSVSQALRAMPGAAGGDVNQPEAGKSFSGMLWIGMSKGNESCQYWDIFGAI